MANNSPTIVAASLSDDQLKTSINNLVAHVDEAMKKMVQSTNNAVGEMEAKLKSLGNLKVDSGGSADGGASKRTKAQNAETEAVEKNVAARDKQIKKNQEVKMSFDQMQTALEKATRLPSEMRMPDMAKSARESFQAFYKGFNEQARQLEPLIQSWERLLQSRHTGNIEQVAQQIRNVKSEIAAIVREQTNLSRTKPQGYIDEIANRNTKIKALRDQLSALESEQQRLKATDPFKDNPYLDRLRTKYDQLTNAMHLSTEATYRMKQATAEELEIQRRRAEESVKSFYTHTMKMPTDQYDVQIAKLENIRALLQRIRSGEVNFFTQTQVTGLEKEERRLVGLIGNINSAQQQVTSSTQQTTQAAQRYTEEIRKQAQAIRESAEYKAGKDVFVTTPSGYDAVINIKDRISIEDKLTEAYQKHIGQKSELDRIEQTDNEVAKERLGTETAITNEISKRKKYSTPETQVGYDVTRDKLAQIIATRNNIERKQVVNWDEQASSIKTLSAALKQYQEAYVKMSATERNSPFGKQMIADMQVLERNIQKFRQQMSRPIDFESVMILPQKTLDDIAYKMRQLASYRSGLNIETQTKEIDQVNRKYAELQKSMNDIMQKNTDMIASNTALGRSWNYMKNRLAFYFTVGASTSFVKNLIDIRSQYELLERSIGILFDSMQTGSKIFSELNQMAIKSPFTTMELGSAAKQLSAYNIAAKDVVDTTRRLADMAAAVGIPIERLTYALGQIKSYGYLNSRDARMFANAGIPLIQNLADMYTKLEGRLVSIGDVYDRIKKKQVSFEDTLKVVHEMTDEGGRFFNFQEKAADTLKVRLANLTLAWNNMLNNMGKSNQGVLTSGLGVLKEMFENWRKIENLVLAIATNFGTVKAVQLLILLNAKGITKQMALQEVLGKRLGTTIYGIARNLKMLAVNPMTWLTIAITAVTYLSWKFWDLTTANENFNKSIADGTKENIASIDKFFDKYKKDIESVGSMNTTDQEKMWERVREEIEKTTKNAQQYIDILEKIPELDKRVSKASGFLEQEKVIQEELNRLAQHGYFNIGGGFADDSYAEALTTIDKYTGEMIRKYGTYEDYIKAFKNEFQGFYDEFRDVKFSRNINEEIDESVKHFKKLESLNWDRILSGGTDEEKLARIRDTFMSLRDNFFATEEMQNAGAEAQALYNRHMDYWITSVAKANGLIKELTVNGKTYSAEDIAAVEERRTEWELFFSYLSDEERKTMDYLVKTNQTGGEEFKKIWDTMADSMKKSNATAYRDLQKKIAELRETPDIVINVVYREMRDKLDEQQQAFEDRWIRPKNWSVRNLSAEKYLEEEIANRTKYGRLMRKTEEDNVEWEERLGKEYQENEKKIKSLNAQLKNKNKLSEADREQKEQDLNLYKDLNKAIDDIGKAENFNYDQFKKGGKGSKKDQLLDALKQEISLVEKLQSDYDKLSKSGASQADALDTIRGAYGKTIRLLNTQLQSYGLPQIDISQLITGKDPNKALAHFKQTLDTLVSKGMLTLERSKELEAVVEKFTLSAKTYNLDMITKGLNNELGKLKDEYELAVELDANPELGGIFADYMDVDLKELPKNAEEAAKKAQQYIDKILRENNSSENINIASLMGKDAFDKWIKSSGHNMEDGIVKVVDNYRQALHKMQVDESKKQMQEWEKLLEKYAEYEYKVTQIQKEAERERETARKKGASQEILDAINNREKQELARVSFEEFQKTPEWIVATGDLANMSKSAIGMLIEQLEKYKRSAKNLSPKQIKQLNSALGKLYKEQRKNNPFKAISNMLDEAKESMATFDEDIKKTQKEIDNLTEKKKENIVEGIADEETDNKLKKAIKRLKELKDAREKSGEIDASSWVSSIQETVGAVQQAVNVFNDLVKAINGVDKSAMDDVFTVLEKGGQGAAVGAQIGGGWGALIGGVAGAATSLIQVLSSASNEKITEQIKDSELAVKRLELAYIDLEHAIDDAYGANIVGAKRAAAAAKELQLQELERQLVLEKSRKSKDRDDDRIVELEKEIKELRYEIKETITSIVDDLLGTDVGSFAENLVSSMVDAFKQGEDYMKVFEEKFDEMIDSMIVKSITSRVVASYLDNLWADIENRIKERTTKEADDWAAAQAKNDRLQNMDFNEWLNYKGILFKNVIPSQEELGRLYKTFEAEKAAAQAAEKTTKATLDAAQGITDDDLTYVMQEIADFKPELGERLKEILGTYYKFGESSDTQLSQLQQGIQGITEDTAGALEAYMNGVSQQVYLQSEYLRRIAEVMTEDANPNDDIEIASLSQILLQLQQSYTVQQSIQSILEGWNNPSGQAVRVELVS